MPSKIQTKKVNEETFVEEYFLEQLGTKCVRPIHSLYCERAYISQHSSTDKKGLDNEAVVIRDADFGIKIGGGKKCRVTRSTKGVSEWAECQTLVF